jgi:spore maturation protein CgeB
MKFVLFCHSLISDWNHGNAHFLRGVATELLARGHQVSVYEPYDAWSVQNLTKEHGDRAIQDFHAAYPQLKSTRYAVARLNLDAVLKDADFVIVHEWNEHELVRRIGEHRRAHKHYVLCFHDTHHRSVTARETMAQYDLRHYDGVLAFGRVIRDIYLEHKWAAHAWVWHEAADTRVFRPRKSGSMEGDIVWVGNWGDEERTRELHEFLLDPIKELKLKARVYGVRYPVHALKALKEAGIEYGGWLPNYRVPEVFANYKATIHVPRRPYASALPGIPTIRPFEALACGIPLLCAPWQDAENLFTPDRDFQVVHNRKQMCDGLSKLLASPERAREMAAHGLATIKARHTCAHRVDQLFEIYDALMTSTRKAEFASSAYQHGKEVRYGRN